MIRSRLRQFNALLSGKAWLIPYRYYRKDSAPAHYPMIAQQFDGARAEREKHLLLLSHYRADLDRIAEEADAPQPRWRQDWFPALDAAIYYAMIRHYHPRQVIEIGSGHSTRFAAQAIKDGTLTTRLQAVDPKPRASLAKLEGVTWHKKLLQDMPPSFWEELGAGDFLFIDSSHLLMPGTDVDDLLNDVLPRLPTGVIVHFHDIFLPGSYPDSWRWRGYNEQQAVAGLILSPAWQVLFSSRAIGEETFASPSFPAILQRAPHALASALWLKKVSS